MKKISVLILSLLVLVVVPSMAIAGQVEGSVQGLTCVLTGKVCPVGDEDPMAAAEKVFVVLTKGNTYYFVPNVDRAVLARHINERIKVTGDVGKKYNAISAKKIEVFKRGAWKTTWSLQAQRELQEKLDLHPGF